ncbi:bifunctional 4-hydroxy-2-oxoglutarate aldolase/2-dehydro-3-deoxy-phosphogluconate aldolase [Petroclostridium sp. X23]|uniref:bifunctional 4-hydroxy-2-oxoglutarate aldolase/2-dehydro-3-deoxy-phosphogluconate aldolase n=1 Tax=Petroclostridium sp. X23 TaxID=3045146 RepID=UPI0024AD60A7|nr:bifunctional 4-hydroxy-2-oxoglutarate aldolase/2-dehydro-3-deoxy-phosphogluconate aldolase [Petroclostridium sp. X23]WHH60738.1 bifunctional 4-hydroxy-2-oxoglutarate aldolase/2-dehydro-3-deoxy-phosphogluconate aldolase [Petroclostridium sp. X23]
MDFIKKGIYDNKIVAIIRGIGADRILDTVAALREGGIKLLEVTFNQEDESKALETLKCLELIKGKYGDEVYLGAGTVMTEEQVVKAVEAGAEYIISPNVDIKVIQKTKELGKLSLPGAFTPSEMARAYNAGADIVKLFPAGILGTEYIKALLAPLSHIPVVAVGGVNVDNVDQFIKAGAIGVGVGGSLVDKKAIYAGEYDKIKQVAQAYVEKLQMD